MRERVAAASSKGPLTSGFSAPPPRPTGPAGAQAGGVKASLEGLKGGSAHPETLIAKPTQAPAGPMVGVPDEVPPKVTAIRGDSCLSLKPKASRMPKPEAEAEAEAEAKAEANSKLSHNPTPNYVFLTLALHLHPA